MSEFIFSVEVYCHDIGYSKEIELVADWTYTPASKGAREDGVPMEPDEPEEFEINSITSNSTVPDPLEISILEEMNSCADCGELVEAIKLDCAT